MARVNSFRFENDTNSNDSEDDSSEEIDSDSRKKAIYVGEPNVYAVDHILKKRKTNKKVQYLVKWKGYSSKDNSWQSAADVSTDLIKEFENNQKKSVKSAATKRRSEVLQESKEEISNGSINASPIKRPKRTPKNATQQLHNKDDLTGSVNLNPFIELVATSSKISMEKEQMKKYENQTGDETQAPNEAPDDAAVPTNFDEIMNEFFEQECCNKLAATSNNISMEKEQIKEYEDQTGDETQAPNKAPENAAVQTNFDEIMNEFFVQECCNITLVRTPVEVQLPNKLEAFEGASMTVVKESVTSQLEIPLGPLAVQRAVPIGASAPMQSSNKIRKRELHLKRKMPMRKKLVEVESKVAPIEEKEGDLLGFDELMQPIFT